MPVTRRASLGLIAASLAAASAAPALAAPRSRLIDDRWTRFGSAGDPDHAAWDALLRAHLTVGADGVARFDYARADRGAVSAYVGRLAALDPTTLAAAPAFAYWTNLYNALTVQTVLDAYPVASIRQIGGNPIAPGPWRRKLVQVSGQALSLDDIEHGILRPVFREPRIHFAVNCAAIGCPNLATRAYASSRLGSMLDANARAFINHPRGARVDGGRLTVSSVFVWFQEDFGGTDASVIAYLQRHADAGLAAQLAGIGRISDHSYDWALNDPNG